MLPLLSAECNLNYAQPTDVVCNILKYKALRKMCVGNVTCLLHSADRRCNINAIYLHVLLYIYIFTVSKMSCRAKSRCLVYKCVSFSGVLCHVKVSEDSKMGTHCIDNQPTSLILKLLIPMACIGYYILWKAEGNN